MIQTGAFEVELNGMPIWSKLKSGRVPQGSELFEIIENQMQLSTPDMKNRFPGSVTVGDHQYPASKEEESTTATDNEEEEEEPDEEEEKEKPAEDDFSEIDREVEDTAE